MGYKKLRKKFKTDSPSIGRWLKWLKRKTKKDTGDSLRDFYAAGHVCGFHGGGR